MDVNQFLPTLPFTDPVLIFFVVLTIILFAPLLLNKLRIQGVALNLSAQNLFVWTKYTGQDPEVNSFYGGGNAADYKGLGYNTITNSSPYTSLSAGLDNAQYPKAIVISLGANITF